ncbi:MAG: transcriptional regulator NrdR [bacterium]
MNCPYCKSKITKVVDKRDSDDLPVTRRRRECLLCTKRFTTYERIENIELEVIKKSGRAEPFDRTKLRTGIARAVKKNISAEQIDELVEKIELRLMGLSATSIHTNDIGRIVMEELFKLDKLSYLRFASVYKDFKSLDDFESEILRINSEKLKEKNISK